MGIFVLWDIYIKIIKMKIRLTENQYDRLKQRLVEFSQKETNEIFVVGNFVIFYIKNEIGTHAVKLEIVSNPKNDNETPNVFYAKVLSPYPANLKDCYLEISQPGQNIGNNFTVLNLGKVNQNNDLTRNPVKYTFKNIFKVDVRNKTNQLIGSYFAQEHDKRQDDNSRANEKIAKEKSNLIQMLHSLKQNDIIKLKIPVGDIYLSFLNKQGDIIQFEVENKNTLPNEYAEFKKYTSIDINTKDEDVIYDKATKSATLQVNAHWNVDGNMEHEKTYIKGIEDGEIIDATEEEKNEDGSSQSTENAKEIMQAIINDPLMKKAFYSQPTLWNLITSAIKGENPRGTGIGPAMEIIRKYHNVKIKKDLGPNADNFVPNITARFKIIGSNIFSNPTNKQTDRLDLKVGDSYKAIYREKIENTHIVLNCSLIKAKIVILSPIPGIIDGYNVEFVKEIEGKNGVTTKKTQGQIQFINLKGSGYYNQQGDRKRGPEETNTTN